jgi:hypothetical protein
VDDDVEPVVERSHLEWNRHVRVGGPSGPVYNGAVSPSWLRDLAGRFFARSAPDESSHGIREAVAAFRAETLDACKRRDRRTLEALLAAPAARGLREDDVELELEIIQGELDVLDLETQAAASGLPIVESQHRAIGADRCYFSAPVCLAQDGGDRPGRLFLTSRRLLFVGGSTASTTWGGVRDLAADERDLVVTLHRADLWRLRLNSYSDARRAAFIARQLRNESPRDPR